MVAIEDNFKAIDLIYFKVWIQINLFPRIKEELTNVIDLNKVPHKFH